MFWKRVNTSVAITDTRRFPLIPHRFEGSSTRIRLRLRLRKVLVSDFLPRWHRLWVFARRGGGRASPVIDLRYVIEETPMVVGAWQRSWRISARVPAALQTVKENTDRRGLPATGLRITPMCKCSVGMKITTHTAATATRLRS